MMMGYLRQGEVQRAYYSKMPHPQKSEAMIDGFMVEIEWFGEVHTVAMPNGAFTPDNLALQFMAYCGVRPSTLDEIEGSMVPMMNHEEAGVTVTNVVFNNGANRLKELDWAPPEQ